MLPASVLMLGCLFEYRVDGSRSDFSGQFHVYSVDWNETTITWSVDGKQCTSLHMGSSFRVTVLVCATKFIASGLHLVLAQTGSATMVTVPAQTILHRFVRMRCAFSIG